MPLDIISPFVSLASAVFGFGKKRKKAQIVVAPPPPYQPLPQRVKTPEPRFVFEPELERIETPGQWVPVDLSYSADWLNPGYDWMPGTTVLRPTGLMTRRELPPVTTGAPPPELPVPVSLPSEPHALEKRLTRGSDADAQPPTNDLPKTDTPCIPLCAAACAPRAPLKPDQRVARALARARAAAARARADRCRLTVIVQGNRVKRVRR